MTDHNRWTDLLRKIERCPEADRYRLQPDLARLIHDLKTQGQSVPSKARKWDHLLQSEALEAQFDNVPV